MSDTSRLKNKLLCLLLLGCALLFAGTPAYAQDKSDLFKKVFGKDFKAQKQRLQGKLFIDDSYEGNALVLITPFEKNIEIKAEPLIKGFTKHINQAGVNLIRGYVTSKGYINSRDLERHKFKVYFHKRKKRIIISTAPAFRLKQDIDLGDKNFFADKATIQPAKFSGYMNLRAKQDYDHQRNFGDGAFDPLDFTIDSAIRYDGVVLHVKGTEQVPISEKVATVNAKSTWLWEEVTVILDDYWKGHRIFVGDIVEGNSGFFSESRWLGVGARSLISLQPERRARPKRNHEIELDKSYIVDLRVNKQLLNRYDLPAGTFEFKNIPLLDGLNEIIVIYKDKKTRKEVKREKTIVLQDLSVLPPGISEIGYYVGIPYEIEEQDRIMDKNNWGTSIFHRYGLTNSLMGGPYIQKDQNQTITGLQTFFTSPAGQFRTDVAFSLNQGHRDLAAALYYNAHSGSKFFGQFKEIRTSLEYFGANFARFGRIDQTNPSALNASVGYVLDNYKGFSPSITTFYRYIRDTEGAPHLLGGSFSLSKRYGRAITVRSTAVSSRSELTGLSFSFSFSLFYNTAKYNIQTFLRKTKSGTNDTSSFGAIFTYKFADTPHRISARKEADSVGLDYEYDDQFSKVYGAGHVNKRDDLSIYAGEFEYSTSKTEFKARTRFTESETARTRKDSLRYKSQRGSFDFVYNESEDTSSLSTSNIQLTTLEFETALVFADGHFAVSEPVKDAFIIVDKHSSLGETEVIVNKRAKADELGPAVIANLQAHSLSTIRIDAPKLQFGLDLGKRIHKVIPAHFSGYYVRAGKEARAIARGFLKDQNGKPLTFKVMKVFPVEDVDGETVTVFSNRQASFTIPGLNPGRYQIKVLMANARNAILEIPKTAKGFFDVGDVTIQVDYKDKKKNRTTKPKASQQ